MLVVMEALRASGHDDVIQQLAALDAAMRAGQASLRMRLETRGDELIITAFALPHGRFPKVRATIRGPRLSRVALTKPRSGARKAGPEYQLMFV